MSLNFLLWVLAAPAGVFDSPGERDTLRGLVDQRGEQRPGAPPQAFTPDEQLGECGVSALPAGGREMTEPRLARLGTNRAGPHREHHIGHLSMSSLDRAPRCGERADQLLGDRQLRGGHLRYLTVVSGTLAVVYRSAAGGFRHGVTARSVW
jgi:hypothetical protein